MAATSIPPNHIEIIEGSARMLYDEKEAVFYNKVQVLNRDLSIQTIKLFSEILQEERQRRYAPKLAKWESLKGKGLPTEKEPMKPALGISVLDALAATGLRSIRYMKEIPNLRHITINDLSSDATDVAELNVKTNGVDASKVTVVNRDACILMYENRDPDLQFDVIDLDPYGTAAPFLDSAVQAVADGGLLCITCTDMPVLSGNYPEVCFAKYGSMPLKSKYVHEMALRILLNSIESTANKYKRHIVPWLSLSVDFYVRVFVRVFESPAEVKNTSLKRIMTFQSNQCASFVNQAVGTRNPSRKEKKTATMSDDIASSNNGAYAAQTLGLNSSTCEESGGRWKIGGPYWGAAMHKQEVVDEILARVDAVRQQRRDQTQMITSSSSTTSTTTIPLTAISAPESLLKSGEGNNTLDSSTTSSTDTVSIATAERLTGILTSISEELKDVAFYYSIPDLASTLQVLVPTYLNVRSALINAGYRVSTFHHDASAIKTDAPNHVVWDIMRAHCKLHPPLGSKHKKLSLVAQRILGRDSSIEVDFTPVPELIAASKKKVARFAPNPEPNWGPKRRAGRVDRNASSDDAAAVSDGDAGCGSDSNDKEDGPEPKKLKK